MLQEDDAADRDKGEAVREGESESEGKCRSVNWPLGVGAVIMSVGSARKVADITRWIDIKRKKKEICEI